MPPKSDAKTLSPCQEPSAAFSPWRTAERSFDLSVTFLTIGLNCSAVLLLLIPGARRGALVIRIVFGRVVVIDSPKRPATAVVTGRIVCRTGATLMAGPRSRLRNDRYHLDLNEKIRMR